MKAEYDSGGKEMIEQFFDRMWEDATRRVRTLGVRPAQTRSLLLFAARVQCSGGGGGGVSALQAQARTEGLSVTTRLLPVCVWCVCASKQVPELTVNKHLKTLQQHSFGALVNYDEGLARTDDKEHFLGSALWR